MTPYSPVFHSFGLGLPRPANFHILLETMLYGFRIKKLTLHGPRPRMAYDETRLSQETKNQSAPARCHLQHTVLHLLQSIRLLR